MITNADIPGLRRLWQEAFGDTDSFLDKFFAVGFSFDRCNCIRQGDKVVAALYWFDCRWGSKKVAYIYAVATDKALRGQGLCRSLMEDTHRQLAAQGYSGAALVPGSEELTSLYAKFGYRGFCPVVKLSVAAEKLPAVKEISPAEYWGSRQKILGENALLQEITALDFLATYGSFYQGESGIFCGYFEGDTFYFEEILEASSQKCSSVQAMYLSLEGDENLPGYFAIALN